SPAMSGISHRLFLTYWRIRNLRPQLMECPRTGDGPPVLCDGVGVAACVPDSMSGDVPAMEPRHGMRAHRTPRAMRAKPAVQSRDDLAISRSPGNGSSRPISIARSIASLRLDTSSFP